MSDRHTEGCGALVYAKSTNRYLFLLRKKQRQQRQQVMLISLLRIMNTITVLDISQQ